MTGDFSRSSLDQTKSYTGVFMQQGRVQVDADWNEQLLLAQHRTCVETQDVIGGSGTPMEGDGFLISATPDGGDFFIHPGRYYVDGLLCEINPEWVEVSITKSGTATLSSSWLDGRPIAKYDWVEMAIEGQKDSIFAQVINAPQPTTQGSSEPVAMNVGNASASLSAGSGRLRRAITYLTQPFYPSPDLNPSLSSPPAFVPGSRLTLSGYCLVYLEAWQRAVNALEDPHIREVALNGPDTGERLQTVWQVRLLEVAATTSVNFCEMKFPEWSRLISNAASTGQMNAQSSPPPNNTNPCLVPPAAGFQGLQNQLYRIEVFQPGPQSGATFVWSRDNGMVETSIVSVNASTPTQVTVTSLGTDDLHSFAINDWVEIVDRDDELDGTPRFLAQIVAPAPDPVSLQITLSLPVPQAFLNGINNPPNPTTNYYRLKRWDMSGSSVTSTGIPIQSGVNTWLQIENGVQVQFTDGYYAPGAWWLIPARTATADIEWPPFQVPNTQPIPQPPFGTTRHFCRIGSISSSPEGGVIFGDCRNLFPPLTGLTGIYYVGGDGQQAMPGQALAEPLQVRVANGGWPVQNVQVQFAFVKPNASGVFTSGNASPSLSTSVSVLVTTDANGIATCTWTLPSNWAPVAPSNNPPPAFQVIATVYEPALEYPDGTPIDMQVVFSAQWSTADQVAYSPSGSCPTLSGLSTVQQALDKLCPPALYYVGGDGQDALPGQQLPLPLQVCVATGATPVTNGKAQVTFAVVSPSTALLSSARGTAGTSASINVPTDANGMASCYWTLDNATPNQQVSATLVGSSSPPIYFNANFDPGVHITEMDYWKAPYSAAAGWADLSNNAVLPAYYFSNQGQVMVTCDKPLNASTVNRGSCFLSVDWLYSSEIEREDYNGQGGFLPGTFQPLILDANLSVSSTPSNNQPTILWKATSAAQLLIADMASELQGLSFPPQVLARLTIKGNLILSTDDSPLYLDGDGFFTASGLLQNSSSGDGRRGGTFEMYFWLTWNVLLTFPWLSEVVSPVKAVPAPWAGLTQYELGAIVLDSNGNLEQATVTGTSAGSAPAWPASGAASTGVPLPDGSTAWLPVLAPYSLGFGSLAGSRQILVTNNSSSQITVQASIAPGSSSAFTVTGMVVLSAGLSGVLTVSFTPPTATGSVSGTLIISTNDPSAPSTTVGLSGAGPATTGTPLLQVPAGPLTFTSGVGATSAAQAVTLTASANNGTTAMSIFSVTIVGPNAAEFAIQSSSTSVASLAAGKTSTVNVAFTPSQPAPCAALLVVNSSNATGVQTLLLMGALPSTGLAVTLSAAALSFGASGSQAITLTNISNVALTADFAVEGGAILDEGSFAVSPANASVAAGASTTITVTFTQALLGRSASLQISFPSVAGSNPQNVPLSGSGTFKATVL